MLTERIIRDAMPGPAPRVVWDRTVAGWGVKVVPSGGKSFVLSDCSEGPEATGNVNPLLRNFTQYRTQSRAGRSSAAR